MQRLEWVVPPVSKNAINKVSLAARLGVLAFALLPLPTISAQAARPEQSNFGTEEIPEEPLLKRPVPVPESALLVLMADQLAKSCLAEYTPSAQHPFASWFLGSEIHQGSATDLIVLPSPEAHQPDYGCFHSVAGIGWFWVFRHSSVGYHLILKTPGNGLEILNKNTHGRRNIQTVIVGSAGRFVTTVTFRFDGRVYQKYSEKTETH